MVHIEGLQKLAQTSRTRRNMEKIQAAIEEVEEYREPLEEWLEAADELRSALTAFAEKTGALDSDLLAAGVQEKVEALCEELALYTPESDSACTVLPENIETVRSELDELESMLEDREYTADDRDSKWDEITEALDGVATGLDDLSALGPMPKSVNND
ncbi:hypothetical protein [Streptomyces luteogriseus]|uniref:hypothetical protein n=1 Tax=Streptomyces luteogriseus TaxID=68233 RepID=UPI0037945223